MLEIIYKVKSGTADRSEVLNILNHKDYQMEFLRYASRIEKNEFIDYIMNFPNLKETDIQNNDLKAHHKYYLDLYENLDHYKNKLSILNIEQKMIDKQIQIAKSGLPDDLNLEEVNMVSTIGIGQSFGYVYENNIHFDFLHLVKEKSIDDFSATIAHEVHHVGLNLLLDEAFLNQLTIEQLFYLYFSGEGLAVKYCNNAEGLLSKCIYEGPKNIGLDMYTWEYLNNDFENTMQRFKQTIIDIRNHKINSVDMLMKEFVDYWMNPYIEGQSKNEVPKLLHFRLYSFGNEIWGIIHDCFGKEKVFEVLKNPSQFPEVYNQALEQLGKKDYKI